MIVTRTNNNRRKAILKTILWGIVGVVVGVAVKGLLLGSGTINPVPEVTPPWIRAAVILGVVAGAMLAFILFTERLRVSRHESQEDREGQSSSGGKQSFDPVTMRLLLPDSLAAPRRYSLAALTAAATVIAFLPEHILLGAQPEPAPVSASRTMEGSTTQGVRIANHDFLPGGGKDRPVHGSERPRLMIIDGNRDGQLALFPHDDHVSSIGGQNACGFCHHQNLPFDQNSSCFECHRDMYTVTDIFSHSSHIEKLGDNDGCAFCHKNPNQIKTRSTAAPCAECHAEMLVEGSFIEPDESGLNGFALGYKEAMHGLCVTCHEESDPDLAECTVCHREDDSLHLRQMGPYVSHHRER